MKQNKIIAWSVCLLALPALGQSFRSESPSISRQVRNLGMGNVGVALKGSHASSPFYNPAGLSDLEKSEMEMLSITGEASANAFDLVGDIRDLVDNLDAASTDADQIRVFDDFVQANTGEYRRARVAVNLVNYARKNFAAGLVLDQRLDLTVREPGVPQFDVRSTADIAAYVAASNSFWDDLLQVGVTFRPTVRLSLDEADQQFQYVDILEDDNGDLPIDGQFENILDKRRFGLGVDVGLKSNLAFGDLKEQNWYKALNPMVGVTWQDIDSPSFEAGPANEQSMNFGLAIHPELAKFKNAFAIDFRNLNQERPFLSKLHVGVETQFPKILALRAGLNQGYVTAGLSVDLKFVSLEGAMYFEEIGVYTRQEGNLRYAAKLAFKI